MLSLALDAGSFLLLFARIGAILMLLPVFSEDAVPGRIRLFIALAVALGMFGLLEPAAAGVSDDQLAGLLVVEILIGLALGMLVRIMFFAAAMAGSIISVQMGLSSALISDPALGGQSALLAKFVLVSAAVVCLAMNVHHLWIRSIIESYNAFPVGSLPNTEDFAQLATTAVQRSMEVALGLAAPFLVFGIVFNAVLGLANRLAPQIQVFFIGLPANILAGLALFSATIALILTTFADIMVEWQRVLWG